MSRAGPALCPELLTTPLYVVCFAEGTNHYEPPLFLCLSTYLQGVLHLSVPLCGQPDPDKKQEADITLFRPLGRKSFYTNVSPYRATYFLRSQTGQAGRGTVGPGLGSDYTLEVITLVLFLLSIAVPRSQAWGLWFCTRV